MIAADSPRIRKALVYAAHGRRVKFGTWNEREACDAFRKCVDILEGIDPSRESWTARAANGLHEVRLVDGGVIWFEPLSNTAHGVSLGTVEI